MMEKENVLNLAHRLQLSEAAQRAAEMELGESTRRLAATTQRHLDAASTVAAQYAEWQSTLSRIDTERENAEECTKKREQKLNRTIDDMHRQICDMKHENKRLHDSFSDETRRLDNAGADMSRLRADLEASQDSVRRVSQMCQRRNSTIIDLKHAMSNAEKRVRDAENQVQSYMYHAGVAFSTAEINKHLSYHAPKMMSAAAARSSTITGPGMRKDVFS